ncbi:thioesterase family protein [Rhodobacteraceae bacterium M382]|nr:thioesterase family protein [Rhodobacteraceae bacterium M382]
MIFTYDTAVHPDWIDYNGHMRDAYYGLVFSHAGVSLQKQIGIDDAYRAQHQCTVYLLEDHKFFLREVHEGAALHVEMRVLEVDAKRYHLHLQMISGGQVVAVCEFMELHVAQTPKPHATPMPAHILDQLRDARISDTDRAALSHRSRRLSLG